MYTVTLFGICYNIKRLLKFTKLGHFKITIFTYILLDMKSKTYYDKMRKGISNTVTNSMKLTFYDLFNNNVDFTIFFDYLHVTLNVNLHLI